MYRSARIAVVLESEAGGELSFSMKTGSIPGNAVGKKIGEHIDAKLDKLFPQDDRQDQIEKLQERVHMQDGVIETLQAKLEEATKPKPRGRPKKSQD